MKKIISSTEQASSCPDPGALALPDLLHAINEQDQQVAFAVQKIIPVLSECVLLTVDRIRNGGRVFYIGAGTSGRLGIVDASEIPPTYGVENVFIALIAGGDGAMRKAVEFAEDNTNQGWEDLKKFSPVNKDVLLGITASGTTPYVLGALQKAREEGLLTIGLTCNTDTPLSKLAEYCLEPVTGPEFVRGSTRMKAGTAQKMTLNMFSTAVMIRLGKIKGDKMIDMQLTNSKLVERGVRMIVEETGLTAAEAKIKLLKYGNVRKALDALD